MPTRTHHIQEIVTEARSASPCIGRIAGVNFQGDLLVEYDGNGPITARMLSGISRNELSRPEQRGREVLLVFEKGNLERPVIIGLMEDRLDDLLVYEAAEEKSIEPKNVVIDGTQITLEAENELLLKCGKGSILIRKDGKIIIKGTDLLSRSSGPQRIRGASVNLN
jgi:hypothetical protein